MRTVYMQTDLENGVHVETARVSLPGTAVVYETTATRLVVDTRKHTRHYEALEGLAPITTDVKEPGGMTAVDEVHVGMVRRAQEAS